MIQKSINTFTKTIELICVLLLVAVVMITLAQVIARFIVRDAIIWAEELARYTGIWLVMLSTSVAILKKAHMVIDLVTSALPKRIQKILEAFSDLIILFVCGYMFYSQLLLANKFFANPTPALRIPTGVVYGGVAVGWALSTLTALYMLAKSAKAAVSPIPGSTGGEDS